MRQPAKPTESFEKKVCKVLDHLKEVILLSKKSCVKENFLSRSLLALKEMALASIMHPRPPEMQIAIDR